MVGWLPLKILVEVCIEGLEEVIWREFRLPVDTDTGVIVIPKPKKMDRLSSRSWRCISLINTISKLMEKLLTTLIMAGAERKGILKEKQFGSSNGRSTMYTVLCAIRQIREIYRREGMQ